MKYKQEIEYIKKYLKEIDREDLFDCYKKELLNGKPVQYIIGNVNFYGNIIKVSSDVLIPRFETELLCEKTIKYAKRYFPDKKIDILDMGCGSGCISITLKRELNASLFALDISLKALDLAIENAKLNDVDINFINADMANYRDRKYDLIISNPPYLTKNDDVMDIVVNNEPHIALYADDNGLYYYKKIIDNIPFIVNSKFLLCFEIGLGQADKIKEYLYEKYNNLVVIIDKDYYDRDRFMFITNIDNS